MCNNGCFEVLSEPNWPSDSGDGEEEGEESSKSNEAKKDGDVEPKRDDGAAGILNNQCFFEDFFGDSVDWLAEIRS